MRRSPASKRREIGEGWFVVVMSVPTNTNAVKDSFQNILCCIAYHNGKLLPYENEVDPKIADHWEELVYTPQVTP
jgi:hypothetical protein